MTEICETSEAQRRYDFKLFEGAKQLLKLFDVDTSEWDKAKAIKWILHKIFYLSIFIGFGYLTVNPSWNIIASYVRSATVYTQTTQLNQSIPLPRSTICFDVMPIDLDPNAPDLGLFAPSSETKGRYQEAVNELFASSSTTKDTILNRDNKWSNQLLYVVHYYLALIQYAEGLDKDLATVAMEHDASRDIVKAINILDDKMKSFNITANELCFKYGSEIKAAFTLFVGLHERGSASITQIIEIDRVAIVQLGAVCFNTPFNQYPLKNGDTILIQAYRPNRIRPTNDDLQTKLQLYVEEMYDMRNDDRVKVGFTVPFENEGYEYAINIISVFRFMSRIGKELQCSETISKELCDYNCRRFYFQYVCGCVSGNGDRRNEWAENACYLNNYLTCFKNENLSIIDEAVENLIVCEEKNEDHQRAAALSLRIANYDYPIFDEIWERTFPQFFGELGGAIGLWLSINILDIILWTVAGVKILIKGYRKEEATDETVASAPLNGDSNAVNSDICERTSISRRQSESLAKRNFNIFKMKILKWTKSINIPLHLLKLFLSSTSLIITKLALSEYVNQPVLVNLNMEYSASIALPNATVCLPLNYGEMNSYHSPNKRSIIYVTALKEYLNSKKLTRDNFIPDDRPWNNSVIDVVHTYLRAISNCEADIFSKCDQESITDKDLVTALYLLENITSNLNITVDELRQRFGDKVAKLYAFNITMMEFSVATKNINIGRTKFLDNFQICYDIPFSLYPLTNEGEFQIWIDKLNLVPSLQSYYFIFQRVSIAFGDLQFTGLFYNEAYSKAAFVQITTLPLELTKYSLISKGRAGEERCGEQTIAQCTAICRIKFIQKLCNCTPTSWPILLEHTNTTHTVTFCDLKRYKDCRNQSEPLKEEECTSQCLRPCQRQEIVVKGQQAEDNMNTNDQFKAYIKLFLLSKNIRTFEERWVWTLDAFLGTIGGIVGFVLGYSLFDMLCFAYMLCTQLFIFFTKKIKYFKNRQTRTIEVQPAPKLNDDVDGDTLSVAVNSINLYKLTNPLYRKHIKSWLIIKLKQNLSLILKCFVVGYFTYLTVKMCIPIVVDYSKHQTVFKVNYHKSRNTSLALKPATLCIDVVSSELVHRSSIQNVAFEPYVQRYFMNITKEKFLEIEWTEIFCYIVHKYLILLNMIELKFTPEILNLQLRSANDPSVPSHLDSPGDLYKGLIRLEEHRIRLNISVNDLRQKLGLQISTLFSLNIYQRTNCQGAALCRNQTDIPIREVTSIEPDYTCYRIPFDQYDIQDPKESFGVTADSRQLPSKYYKDVFRSIKIDLLGGNASSYFTRAPSNGHRVVSYFNRHAQIQLAISVVYRLLKPARNCSEYRTRENCISDCRIELFRKMCNCTPTVWSNWATSEVFEECKLSTYVECVNFSGYDDISCVESQCGEDTELCENWSYTILADDDTQDNEYVNAEIVLQLASFDYPIYEEEYKTLLDDFFGSFGGAVGFYLGIDFFIILQFIIKVILTLWKMITRFLRRNEQTAG